MFVAVVQSRSGVSCEESVGFSLTIVSGRQALFNLKEFFIHSVDETTLAYTRRDREEERE